MTPTIARRLEALEARHGESVEPLLILRVFVRPGHLDEHPAGTLAAPPHLPAVDRLPGESREEFVGRLSGMIAHLPSGTVVRATSRHAPGEPTLAALEARNTAEATHQ